MAGSNSLPRTWDYPSSRGVGTYTVTLATNGLLGCTCKGWIFKRKGQLRECPHTTDVCNTEGFAPERRGDYLFVDAPPLTPLPSDDILIPKGIEMAATTTTLLLEGMKASAMVEGRFHGLLDSDGYIIPAKFDATFSDGRWTMDEKLDGHRMLVRKAGASITTPLHSIPSIPEQILSALHYLPDGVYDGELLVPGGVSTDVPNLALRGELIYAVFDLLEVFGETITMVPYSERRKLLEIAIHHVPADTSAVVLVAQHEPTWANVQAIWARGGEGAILKLKSSTYRPGDRSGDWLKVKRLEAHTVVVTGFDSGSLGPEAVILFTTADGVAGRTKNIVEPRATKADIGRRLVVQAQQRMRGSKSLRHPRADHWAGEAE